MQLEWGNQEDKRYETGVSRGVLYPSTGAGVIWNGLINVSEQPQGGEATARYFEGSKVGDDVVAKEFQARLQAFAWPAEFGPCMGERQLITGLWITRQPRDRFGLSYRTDVTEDKHKIHLVYNATATPGARSHKTASQTPEPSIFEWTIDAVPPVSTTHKPTAHYVIHTEKISASTLTSIENILYGTASTAPRLPTPAELAPIFAAG